LPYIFSFKHYAEIGGGFLRELLTRVETLEHSSQTGNKKAQSKRSDDYCNGFSENTQYCA